jgi:DNA (cytosine-5)-methyltransferase 1
VVVGQVEAGVCVVRIGSLCSGIGLLEYGLECAGVGDIAWQCEIDPFCRAVLAKHWPDVPRFDDVRTLDCQKLAPVDLVCFGSPCQNLSSAGDRSGLDGPKSRIFWDCLRVVGELRPRYVVFENVASGASRWVDPIRGALERLGYATLPLPIAASDCGAPHRRGRVFIVAAADSDGESKLAFAVDAEVAASPTASDVDRDAIWDEQGRRSRSNRSESSVARLAGAEFVADPYCQFRDTREGVSRKERTGRPVAAGASSDALPAGPFESRRQDQGSRPSTAERGWRPPVPDILRVVHGRTRRSHPTDGGNGNGTADFESGFQEESPEGDTSDCVLPMRSDRRPIGATSQRLSASIGRGGSVHEMSRDGRSGVGQSACSACDELRRLRDIFHASEARRLDLWLRGLPDCRRRCECQETRGRSSDRATEFGDCSAEDERREREVHSIRAWHRAYTASVRKRISALGNACTPQQAEVVGRVVMILEALRS